MHGLGWLRTPRASSSGPRKPVEPPPLPASQMQCRDFCMVLGARYRPRAVRFVNYFGARALMNEAIKRIQLSCGHRAES